MKKISNDAKRTIVIFSMFIIGFFLVISFGCGLNYASGDEGGVMEYISAFVSAIFGGLGLFGYWNMLSETWVNKAEKTEPKPAKKPAAKKAKSKQ